MPRSEEVIKLIRSEMEAILAKKTELEISLVRLTEQVARIEEQSLKAKKIEIEDLLRFQD